MHRTKRLTAVKLLPALLCLLTMLMTACGGSTSSTSGSYSKAASNKQVFLSVAGIGAGNTDIRTFDPIQATDQPSGTAISTVFTGLVSISDQGKVAPQLASSWDVSPDKKTYTFHLKPDLKFSDGAPLTSSDVAYSLDRALQKSAASPTGPYYLRYIKDAANLNTGKIKTIIGDSVVPTDPSTLKITISQPIPFFLDTLTYPCAFVVEKSLITKYGNTQWTNHLSEGGGDGPFKVKAWKHSQEIDLIPNTNYYDKKPQLSELIYKFYKNGDSTRADYLANRLDDASVPLANYESDSTRPDFFKFPIAANYFYVMNYNQKPFDNIKIRQAFALTINKSLIVSKIWHNSSTPTNHYVPQGVPGYNANLKGPDGTTSTSGNPTLAKQLLQQGMQQAGLKQLPAIKLTYSSGGIQAQRDEVTEMQQEWQNVLGVHVDTEDVEYNTLIGDISQGAANPLQFFWGPGWIEDYPDPSDWLTLQFDAGQSQNNMNYGQNKSSAAIEQQAVQKQLEQADVEQDATKRLALYNDAEQKLSNDVAWLPMEQSNAFGLRKPCVHGVPPNIQGITPPDDWANIYITTNPQCANITVS
jgi:oligopeptide transport system substrate-binding protein